MNPRTGIGLRVVDGRSNAVCSRSKGPQQKDWTSKKALTNARLFILDSPLSLEPPSPDSRNSRLQNADPCWLFVFPEASSVGFSAPAVQFATISRGFP